MTRPVYWGLLLGAMLRGFEGDNDGVLFFLALTVVWRLGAPPKTSSVVVLQIVDNRRSKP